MLISIIIPYFNDEKYISRSVNSALAQTYKNTEIIIIDSEYSENSKKILKSISARSKKIKVILNKKSIKFPGIGRNIGIKEAKGELIAFLDSDDYWKKNKLEFQLKEMKKKNSDVIFTGFEAKNEKNKFLYRVKSPAIKDFELLLRSCPLCCSSVLIKKKCFKNKKFKDFKTKEDYDLWLNLSINGYLISSTNQILTFYTVRKNSLSSFHINKLTNAFKIYNYSLNFSFFYSIFCVFRLYSNAFIKKYLKNE